MRERWRGFVIRFTLVHLTTYWVIGMVFYQLQDYEQALAAIETFELWRELEDVAVVALVFVGQIVRGALLAVLLVPFYPAFLRERYGWAYLFLALYGLTLLGSLLFFPQTIELLLDGGTVGELIRSMEIGIPEITVQMLVFSFVLWRWELRRARRAALA